MLIQLEDVTKTYVENGRRMSRALNAVSINIEKGEFMGFVGPSGSGKSTLLNIVGGLEFADAGRVCVNGRLIGRGASTNMAHYRNHEVGFIFQKFNLISALSVFENVELPLLIGGVKSKQARAELVDRLIAKVDLVEQRNQSVNLLSGGQMQRVAVARALVMGPQFVLADEPTANLDRDNARKVLRLMRDLNEELAVTFIFASHDQLVIDQLSRTVRLQDGAILSTDGGGAAPTPH